MSLLTETTCLLNPGSTNSNAQLSECNTAPRNFYLFSVLFSACDGCTVACLSLATARLGAVGAWQSSMLSLSYMISAMLGSTYLVKRLGARNAIQQGMLLYCTYIASFWLASGYPRVKAASALIGAAIGGLGAGVVWSAYLSYLSQAAKDFAKEAGISLSESTSNLAGAFAFIYLTTEVFLRILSSGLAGFVSWRIIFGVYTLVAYTATFGMVLIKDYGNDDEHVPTSTLYKVTATLQLLFSNRKMVYLVPLSATFGFTSAFINSYIDGEVIRAALNDEQSVYIGVLTAWIPLTAASSSLTLCKIRNRGLVIGGGALCFLLVVLPFVLQPDSAQWSVWGLLVIYSLQGIGRATFEGPVKAVFVDFFPTETVGASSNISLHYGLANAIGNFLVYHLRCSHPSKYCVQYESDKTTHDILGFQVMICFVALAAILGYFKAAAIHKKEHDDGATSTVRTIDV